MPAHDTAAFVWRVATWPTLCVAPRAQDEHVLPPVSHSETKGRMVLS